MRIIYAILTAALLTDVALAEVLVQEDFENDRLAERGWYDIAKWGPQKSLSIATAPDIKPISGNGCLKIRYAKGDTGGWMHVRLPKAVSEVYCRYYRLFPQGWEWPKGYGPHDSILFAGSYGAPTDTDLSVYLDFWKTAETYVRVATARQRWGYGGYSDVLRKHGGVANRVAFNVARSELVELSKWHCVEYYAKLSEPGKRNGRLKLWVNGKLVCDLPELPLVDRNHAGIRFNHWMLGPYFHGGSHQQQWNYLDALVIATQYVGTLQQQGNQPPRARLTHSRPWGSTTATFDAARSADPDGTITAFAWDFGDGQTGSGKSIQHTYRRPGEYLARVTVEDRQGEKDTAQLAIAIAKDVGSGNGLKAEYYEGENLHGEPIVRVERQIAFQRRGWEGRYLRGEVGDRNGDHYSCRWTGLLQPTHSEPYTITLDVNDGGRLWFDGKLLIDAWDQPQRKSASLGTLVAGKKYPIRIEHHKGTYESTGDFKAVLLWQSPSVPTQTIPSTQLYLPVEFVEPQ